MARRWLRPRGDTGTGRAGGAGGPRDWTLDPSGDWHRRWLCVAALPVLYDWVGIVCRCCFPGVQEQLSGLWLGLDWASDGIYLMDVGLRLHTGFLEDGVLVRDLGRVRRRYLRSPTFRWDAASLLPLALLCPAWAGPAARANRCLRAPRLLEALERWETRTGRPNALRLARLVLLALVAIHWHACLYFALSARLGLGTDAWVCPNATRPLRRYLHSVYVSTLVLATVGDTPEPRREAEFLFATAGFLLAVLGFAAVTGGVASVIANVNAADAAFYPDPAPVLRYLRARGAGGRLARRVTRWHRHLRAQRKPPAEREALRHLPRGLRAEVAASVHLPALRRVELFRGWGGGVLRQLVPRLRPQVFGPGEFVCRRGDVGREMYFVREGRLAVLADDGVTRLAVLGQGLYFGEISLINIRGNAAGNRRTADIVSIGYSDLFCLAKEDLAEVLAEFPRARAALEARGRRLLLRAGKLDAGAEAAAAEAERRARALEGALGGLRARAARLLAQLEAGTHTLAQRVQRLEERLRDGRGGAPRKGGPAGGGGPPGAHSPGGVQGPRKAQGVPRVQGPPGAPSGAQGPPKAQGASAAQGPIRAEGPPKAEGATGVRGPPKARGVPGAQAPIRAQGPPKAQGVPKVQGPLRAPSGVRGPIRAQGPPKAQGPTGVRGPPKAQGPPGAQGPIRAQGPPKAEGATGMRGPRKAQGVPRAQGPPGAPSGAQGPPKAQGASGAQGPVRAQGPPKAQGPPGAQGPPMA
ncbi:cyclic nucleotide-gated channel alpha-4 [Athene noctua]|uniref:cyclic nucleotide-gated channel alpha-4 n=1 Tax=Athene noctua TaxID=126797 RepID=UPI003EBAB504